MNGHNYRWQHQSAGTIRIQTATSDARAQEQSELKTATSDARVLEQSELKQRRLTRECRNNQTSNSDVWRQSARTMRVEPGYHATSHQMEGATLTPRTSENVKTGTNLANNNGKAWQTETTLMKLAISQTCTSTHSRKPSARCKSSPNAPGRSLASSLLCSTH